jgi:hypothetical protein
MKISNKMLANRIQQQSEKSYIMIKLILLQKYGDNSKYEKE